MCECVCGGGDGEDLTSPSCFEILNVEFSVVHSSLTLLQTLETIPSL